MASGTRVILVGLVIVLNGMAREDYTRNFDKSVTLHQGQAVLVEHKFGDIVVRTHPQLELTIHAEIRVSAPDRSRAEEFANRIRILTDSSPSEFAIRTRYPESSESFLGFHNASYCVRYEVTIPEKAPLEVRNSFGAVSVTGLKANGNIRTSHGNITFQDGKGTERFENSFAGVELARNTGDVVIENTNGNVSVEDVTGSLTIRDRFASISAERVAKNVTITNSNGNVNISSGGGAGVVTNAFGNVIIHDFRGDMAVHNGNGRVEGSGIKGPTRIENSFGTVALTNIDGGVNVQSRNGEVSVSGIRGDASVRTSFAHVEAADISGALTVDDANGSVNAINVRSANVKTSFAAVVLKQVAGTIDVNDQNGAVDVSGDTQAGCHPIVIHTSFSPICVRLNGTPSYRVTATTSFGKIRSDFPLTVSGSISSDALSGTLGDGRCELRLTDNNGSIDILKSGSR